MNTQFPIQVRFIEDDDEFDTSVRIIASERGIEAPCLHQGRKKEFNQSHESNGPFTQEKFECILRQVSISSNSNNIRFVDTYVAGRHRVLFVSLPVYAPTPRFRMENRANYVSIFYKLISVGQGPRT